MANKRLHPRFGLFADAGKGVWLYALGLKGGLTKIGITHCPRTRMTQHMKASGNAVTWAHVFGPPIELSSHALRIEKEALKLASEVGQRVEKEVFFALSRDDALRCVRAALSTIER